MIIQIARAVCCKKAGGFLVFAPLRFFAPLYIMEAQGGFDHEKEKTVFDRS